MVGMLLRGLLGGGECAVSLYAMTWVMKTDITADGPWRVLMSLASYAGDRDECWPSIATLMSDTQASRPTVMRHLRWLEDHEYIGRAASLRESPTGRGLVQGATVFKLHTPAHLERFDPPMAEERPSRFLQRASDTPCEDQCLNSETVIGSEDGPVDEGPSGPQYLNAETVIDQCLNSETDVVSKLTFPHTPYKEEPVIEPDLTPPSPTGHRVGSGRVGEDPIEEHSPVGRPAGRGDEAVAADWALVRSCLPEPMRALDDEAVQRIVPLLRERLTAGWRPRQLQEILAANPLPPAVRSMQGLVRHRIDSIPVAGAPRPPAAERRDERPAEPHRTPLWVVKRAEARRAGDPDASQSRQWWMDRWPGSVELDQDARTEAGV